MKKLMKYDSNEERIEVENIKHLSDTEQAEIIAEKFAEISLEFKALDRDRINIPFFNDQDIPNISEKEVIETLESLKVNKSERKNDIPAKIFKHFSKYLYKILTVLINECIRKGCWPNFLKLEAVTPVPKTDKPKNVDELRNISGLMTMNKILEKIICKMMILDMKEKLDPCQYANQKGLSIQHYLVKMLDRILSVLDNKQGENVAVIATMVDWRQAFPRQCPTLGVQSFIRNGVRPALIPILMSFFEGRQMFVKWHGIMSSVRNLKGGGPQGSTIGILEYLSLSNNNSENVPDNDRYKFVDDLTILETVKLKEAGIASHNFKLNIPSNLPTHNQIIPKDNLKTQKYMSEINNWTEENQMKLNPRKTKAMIFNFTKNNQFTTNLTVKDEKVEIVNEAKLLGTIITNDLTWNRNTEELVKDANRRMRLLHAASKYTSKISDMKTIYTAFIRSKLDHSSVVWNSGISKANTKSIERIQKSAVKMILKDKYKNYEDALRYLNIDTLSERRNKHSLKFAKNSLRNEKVRNLFPVNTNRRKNTRNDNKYKVNFAKTERYFKSSIPTMQRMLNKHESDRNLQLLK